VAIEPTFLDFPFAIDARGRTATTTPGDHVRDLIWQVLFTSPGERVNRPEFGCGLKQLVFAPASGVLAAATEQLVHGALIRWLDPVIVVERVAVAVEDATVEVTVAYRSRPTGEVRTDVFRHPVPA
jgi:phage baseplate assembly protein W